MNALSTRERAFALAAARALGAAAPEFCRRRGEQVADEAARLGDAAAQARAQAALGRATPAGLEQIDRSWYVPPPRVARPEAATHLCRAAFAQLVSMAEPGGGAGSLSRRTPEQIERALVALGRRRVALAFVGAPRAGLAQLCARLGEPAASQLVAEVRAWKAAAPPHDEIKAAQRALFRSGDDVAAAPGLEPARALFFRVGAAWLAPALARDGDELDRVAQRLPRLLGEALLAEASAPASDAERAAALALLANAALGTI